MHLKSLYNFSIENTSYKVQRPDSFVIELTTAKKSRRFIYDGTSFTAFSPKVGYFATVLAPPRAILSHISSCDTKARAKIYRHHFLLKK